MGFKHSQALTDNQMFVLKFLYGRPKQMARLDEIVAEINLRNRGHIHSVLRGLINRACVRLVSRGLYELAGRGRRYVEGAS
jgi:hypothetical protein